MECLEITENSWLDCGSLPTNIKVDFDALWNLHPEEKGKVKLYGKVMETPRWQESYLQPYYFSGMSHGGGELPEILKPFLVWANELGYGDFNQVFLNWYENGNYYIGTHSDDETQLKKDSAIVSISLGQERIFRIRNKKDKSIVLDVPLPDKEVVVMAGKFQKELLHEIVKVNGKKGESMSPRINITFRQFNL